MMKISSYVCHNCHKSKLAVTRFYCFINGKSKKWSPKNLELDINVAKNGPFYVFSAANSKFCDKRQIVVRHENPHAVEYCWPCRLWWFGLAECKDDADWVKQCMMMETEGTRLRGRMKKTW